MRKAYVIALDQGTTSSRAMLVDADGRVVDAVQNPFPQRYPQPGWVEHDPLDILSSQLGALAELTVSHGLGPADIAAIGITNQRETTVVWNRETGRPVGNAIVWQCRRTAPIVEELCGDPAVARRIADTTGLVPDAYFSASKVKWLLDNIPGARADAEAGKLAFGTVDSWLVWSLTDGQVHATDVTNASRTMLYDIHEMRWDPWLLDLFGIPASMLPDVCPSSADYGVTANPGVVRGVPIRGVAGDQQAALFGQCCFEAGQAKNTYGTGCFLLMHTGREACRSTHRLVTTLAACGAGRARARVRARGQRVHGRRPLAMAARRAGPHRRRGRDVAPSRAACPTRAVCTWCPPSPGSARRTGTPRRAAPSTASRAARAARTSCAPRWSRWPTRCTTWPWPWRPTRGCRSSVLKVDGGASANDFLMQFQSDLLRTPLHRPQNTETTALGAAFYLARACRNW